jgi:hypothetical protein
MLYGRHNPSRIDSRRRDAAPTLKRCITPARIAALVFIGSVALSCRSRPPAAEAPAPAPPPPPPAVSAPAPVQSGTFPSSSEVACLPNPDRGPVVLRDEPSSRSSAVATLGSNGRLVKVNARSVKGDGDWVQVRYDQRSGWVDGASVVCRLTPAQAREVIAPEADAVLNALAARNMADLAKHVHPVKGLRFSPYVDVDPRRAVVLSAGELLSALNDAKPRRWGSEDGSGEPISRTFARYYERFVYDKDFAGAGEKRFNEFGKKSTTRPNLWEIYPNAIVVEAHVPGRKPEAEGMDWSSLLLVFEQHDARWYLSALVHDQWTV